MQSDSKQIYKITAERTGKPEETYKDIGNFVFKELNSYLSQPKSLITKLKGVGYWFLRKKRIQIILEQHSVEEGKQRRDFRKDSHYEKYCDKLLRQQIFKERIIEYNEYVTLKDGIRKKRYETAVLLKPTEGENESNKPSKTDIT